MGKEAVVSAFPFRSGQHQAGAGLEAMQPCSRALLPAAPRGWVCVL